MSFPSIITKKYEALWSDPALQARIEDGIRVHRQSEVQVQIQDSEGRTLSGVDVQVSQQDSDFHFGANIFMLGGYPEEARNRGYEQAFCDLFNAATVPFYWPGIEPEQGKFRYTADSKPMSRRPPPDAVIAFCQEHGLRMHGHTLVWESTEWSIPRWLPRDAVANEPLWEARVRDIAERYGQIIKRWDVLNEPVADYYQYVPTHPMPEDYFDKAFRWAEKYFPSDVRLDINEVPGAWGHLRENYIKLIKHLRGESRRLGALGLQFHVHTDAELDRVLNGEIYTPEMLLQSLDAYAQLNLPVHVSEITLTSPDNTPAGEEAQALAARNFYRLWFSHPCVEGITWWNLPDGGAAPGQNEVFPGLVRADMSRKRSYEILHDLLHNEWRTDFRATTDEHGCLGIRGFHGTHRISVNGRAIGEIKIGPQTPKNLSLPMTEL
jgi:endo-1,4-beta-xylanase